MITTIKTNNKKIERDLAHLLKAIASWEIHIENYRIAETQHHHFDIHLAFQSIDQLKRGYITKKKFHDFLTQGKVNCQFKEWEYVYSFCFKEDDIDFKEFINFILPQSQKDQIIQSVKETTNQLMTEWNREFILRFFERIIVSIRELNQLKYELHQWVYYDIHEIWKVISTKYPTKKTGYLAQDSIRDLIEQYGFHFSNEEFQGLVKILKCKQKQDYLTQKQLYNLISPPIFLVSNSYLYEKTDSVQQKEPQTYDHQKYRKSFDLVREDRPKQLFDSNYMENLREHYKQHKLENQKYQSNLRNQTLQYNNYFSSNYSQLEQTLHRVDTVFNQYGSRIRYYQ
ncbi:unnamed protein product [Paramecium primaurelia]|uniref:EF-hand domain-containing protein n=1 Tax=Paramecium primaurelia TaxID=5886 RepID=A0A8S1QHS9_PARPR|nr:unnamed protein product [Paramecium primaurelia]